MIAASDSLETLIEILGGRVLAYGPKNDTG
jgi:hypothetical protein